MQQTPKLNLKKPDLTDYVNIADLNNNMDILDATVGELKEGSTEIAELQTTDKTLAGAINEVDEKVSTHLADDVLHNISVKTIKLNKDSNGIFTTIEHRRKSDDTLARKSVLSGGTSPQYTTRTVTYYASDGKTVIDTIPFTLSYDTDGVLVSEV